MKQQYYFLRSAPYDYLLPGKTLYQSFDDVACGKEDPPLQENAKTFFFKHAPHITNERCLVLHALSKRCEQTADFFKGTRQREPLLAEIGYSMPRIINENAFYDSTKKPNVRRARQAFVDALTQNRLEEPYSDVLSRIKELFFRLEQEPFSCIVLISHGFFLKMIELYIRDKGIFVDPTRLKLYFTGDTETFHFCEGFIAEQRSGHVKVLSYISNKVEKNLIQ